jgi:tripartite-type tricarboxylate transporter receptor subunit TctC
MPNIIFTLKQLKTTVVFLMRMKMQFQIKIITRLMLQVCAAAIGIFGYCAAQAQLPQALVGKQIKIIVPQTAAGASDAIARIMAQELSKRWSSPVIVENRPGAGGNIGSDTVAKSTPDGTTWLMSYSGTHSINPALYKNMPFDTEKDLAPLGSLATLPFVLVITPSLPVNNLAEFVAYAKANPGKINIASSGNGSVAHLLDQMLDAAADIKTTHVPYKGVAPALTDVMSGQVQGIFASAPSVMGQIKAGQVKALAASATTRSQALPELPTFGQAGYPSLSIDSWFAFFVPSATPKALREQIHTELDRVLADKEVIAQLASKGASTLVMPLDQFEKVVQQDMTQWGKAVRDSGATID